MLAKPEIVEESIKYLELSELANSHLPIPPEQIEEINYHLGIVLEAQRFGSDKKRIRQLAFKIYKLHKTEEWIDWILDALNHR